MKQLSLISLLFALSLSANTPVIHDIHVSICEIDLRKETAKLTMKTYLDDLQLAMGLSPGETLPVGYTSSDKLIRDYIAKTLSLMDGDKLIAFEVKSIDASTDAVWINCEILHPVTRSINISNTFLTELYDDQTNIIKIIKSTGRTTMKMDKKTTTMTIEI